MIELSAAEQARRDRAEASYRNTSELLGSFREKLIDSGFTEEGAEQICATYFMMCLDEST